MMNNRRRGGGSWWPWGCWYIGGAPERDLWRHTRRPPPEPPSARLGLHSDVRSSSLTGRPQTIVSISDWFLSIPSFGKSTQQYMHGVQNIWSDLITMYHMYMDTVSAALSRDSSPEGCRNFIGNQGVILLCLLTRFCQIRSSEGRVPDLKLREATARFEPH